MKKINLFLIFVLCISIFSACKKEDEKEPTTKENLVGKTWVITDSKTAVSTPLGPLPDNITNDFDPTLGIKGQTIIFNENGTFQIAADATQSGTWNLSEDGQRLTFSGLVEGDLIQVIDNQTLTQLQTFEVTTLTSTKLIIQNSTAVPIPTSLSGLPIPITATITLNITFDKQ